jgi:hypothetical protein
MNLDYRSWNSSARTSPLFCGGRFGTPAYVTAALEFSKILNRLELGLMGVA